jgi:hypothetical protein
MNIKGKMEILIVCRADGLNVGMGGKFFSKPLFM